MTGINKTIGIVGGVGPYAGIDITRKVFDSTVASADHEHLSVLLLSSPSEIGDRTAFILGNSAVNPAEGIFNMLKRMESAGVDVAAIACNTAHSPLIFDAVTERLKSGKSRIKLVHMIREAALFIKEHYPGMKRVGVLATDGTLKAGVYDTVFGKEGLSVIYPDASIQKENVHRAIYDPSYGIKASSNPVSDAASKDIRDAATHLAGKGAECVVLGCTELPLAFAGGDGLPVPLIDANLALARALVKSAAPEKLKPLSTAAKADR